MASLDAMYTIVFSIFVALVIILLIATVAVALKIIETLKKLDEVIDDINGKAKQLDGLFGIIDHTSNTVASISNKVTDIIVGIVQKLLDKKNKKEE